MKDNEVSGSAKSGFGKFGSAEELLSAYNALEREFTKRCQQIKLLQAELSSHSGAQAKGSARTDAAETAENAQPDKADCGNNDRAD